MITNIKYKALSCQRAKSCKNEPAATLKVRLNSTNVESAKIGSLNHSNSVPSNSLPQIYCSSAAFLHCGNVLDLNEWNHKCRIKTFQVATDESNMRTKMIPGRSRDEQSNLRRNQHQEVGATLPEAAMLLCSGYCTAYMPTEKESCTMTYCRFGGLAGHLPPYLMQMRGFQVLN